MALLPAPDGSTSCPRSTSWPLLPDAEVSEDDVQDLVGADPARDAAQAAEGQPHAVRRQRQVPVPEALVLLQRRHALRQVGPVPRLCQAGGPSGQGVPTPGGGQLSGLKRKSKIHCLTAFFLYNRSTI